MNEAPGTHISGGVHRSSNTFFGDTWANFKRWLLRSFRPPQALILDLVTPIIFFLLFEEVFGNVAGNAVSASLGAPIDYVTYLLPVIAMQVSMTSVMGSGATLVEDIKVGIFEKVMATPMNKTAVFLGKICSDILRIAVQIGILLGLGILLGAEIRTGFIGALGIIGIGILFSIWFLAISNTLAVTTKDQDVMMSAMMSVLFPLMFLSSGFLPLGTLPEWIQTFAKFNPVNYGIDAARALVLERDVMMVIDVSIFSGMWNTIIPATVVLLGLDIVFGGLAVFSIARETSADVK